MRSKNNTRPDRTNSFEFRPSEDQRLRRDIYGSTRGKGYDPEIANILADHGVMENRYVEMQGPRPDGQAGYAAVLDRQPVISDAPRRQEVTGVMEDTGLTRASSAQEAQINVNNMRAALDAGAVTQQLRDQAGVGITRSAQDRSNDLRAALEERKDNRGHQASERALDRSSMETIAGLENPNPAKPETMDLGDGRSLAYYNGQMVVVDQNGAQVGSVERREDGAYVITDGKGGVDVKFPPAGQMDPLLAMQASRIAGELAGGKLSPEERKRKEAEYAALMGNGNRQGGNAGAGQNGPPVVRDQAAYDALPSGSVYMDPSGKQRRKP